VRRELIALVLFPSPFLSFQFGRYGWKRSAPAAREKFSARRLAPERAREKICSRSALVSSNSSYLCGGTQDAYFPLGYEV
jgi:hypothetical protein